MARRAKSDRKRHARPQRNAVMRHAGRKIQHVPLLQRKRLVRLEIRQHIHIDIRHGHVLFGGQRPGPDPPFATPQRLNQKHVVAVHVRPHVPAVRRVTRHNVVEPPRRRKPKTLEQGRRLGNPAIHLLHQQTPVRFGKIRKILLLERAMAKFPGIVPAALQNEPRNSLFLHRQARQFLRRERRFEIRKRVPNEERLLPPPVAQKRIDRHASRQAFGQIGQIIVGRHVGAQGCRGKIQRKISRASSKSGQSINRANTTAAALIEAAVRGRSYPQYGHTSACASMESAQEGHSLCAERSNMKPDRCFIL